MTIIRNLLYNQIIILLDGQEICPRCKGQGFNDKYDIKDEDPIDQCFTCDGDGFVDWAQLPFLSSWEDQDIQYEEDVKYDACMEKMLREFRDQETGSFYINK